MRPYRKKRELADWIRRRLGAPFINVMVDTTQIDDCIDHACDFFGEFAGGIGNVESILLINPELVYYDGTGLESQPGPKKGKWRRPLPPFLMSLTVDQLNNLTLDQYMTLKNQCGTVPTTSTPSTATSCCPPNYNSSTDVYGGDDRNPKTNYQIDSECCPKESQGPGPGWCGTGIQPEHCFTETDPGDPLAVGPYWVEGDTTAKPQKNGYLFKTVYPVPSDIIAVGEKLNLGMFGIAGANEDNALFSPLAMMMQGGGSWGMTSAGKTMDNRWGFWMGSGGGYVDIVGYQLGMQYLEMFRQLFTVKTNVMFNEVEHTVTITPPPSTKGVIAVSVIRKVADEAMYGHQWVRNYALALTMIDIGMNVSKYINMTMPGGGAINAELYLTRGDALREKLEKQLTDDHMFNNPVDFFVG